MVRTSAIYFFISLKTRNTLLLSRILINHRNVFSLQSSHLVTLCSCKIIYALEKVQYLSLCAWLILLIVMFPRTINAVENDSFVCCMVEASGHPLAYVPVSFYLFASGGSFQLLPSWFLQTVL